MSSHFRSRGVVTVILTSLFLFFAASSASQAASCIAPDNGGGTATLPNAMPTAACLTGYEPPTDVFRIIDGLPAGTTIEIDAEHTDFTCGGVSVCSFAITPGVDCNDPGGSLGGEKGCADTVLHTSMTGTGTLVGFSRMINIAVGIEHHFQSRVAGTSPQSFDTDMFRLFGQITGDPDFDLLRIVGGTDFGLPSPGHTTLVANGGNWQVDSFFDITYRIDFVGAPGGSLAGRSGSTTATIRMQLGSPPVYDHLECFKAKDSVKLRGIVDLPSLAGTPYDAAGCVIGAARKFCTPARKIVVTSTPPATPLPGQDLTSDYICYRIKCPKVDLSQNAADQFGSHALTRMRQGELCVPAVRLP